MKNILYFDLETQKSADEVGGWHKIVDMRLSIGVIYSTARGEYKIFAEQQVDDLIRELQRADLVVGYNHLRFDFEVLHGYTAFDMRQLPSLDLLLELQEKVNRRLPLDDVANATLGVQKTADGLQALEWFRQGRLLDIAEYCCYDVKVTKMIHEYGVANKALYYRDNFGQKIKVPVTWTL
jgi:DEAD/DEAH box helicase domain-containing protein